MKTSLRSLSISGALVAVVACAGAASAQEAPVTAPDAIAEDRALAEAAMRLEGAFAEQFADGRLDRDALAPHVEAILAATPADARENVQAQIAQTLEVAEQILPEMTAEERQRIIALETPPRPVEASGEGIGTAEQGIILSPSLIGLRARLGFGGFGAFGFPFFFPRVFGLGTLGSFGLGVGTIGLPGLIGPLGLSSLIW
jgi:hypothetical protein